MASVRIEVELPIELADAIGAPQDELPQRVTELVAIELTRRCALAPTRLAGS